MFGLAVLIILLGLALLFAPIIWILFKMLASVFIVIVFLLVMIALIF